MGAATGVKDFNRVEALIKADVDVVVVDTAHGHSDNVRDTVRAYQMIVEHGQPGRPYNICSGRAIAILGPLYHHLLVTDHPRC